MHSSQAQQSGHDRCNLLIDLHGACFGSNCYKYTLCIRISVSDAMLLLHLRVNVDELGADLVR